MKVFKFNDPSSQAIETLNLFSFVLVCLFQILKLNSIHVFNECESLLSWHTHRRLDYLFSTFHFIVTTCSLELVDLQNETWHTIDFSLLVVSTFFTIKSVTMRR